MLILTYFRPRTVAAPLCAVKRLQRMCIPPDGNFQDSYPAIFKSPRPLHWQAPDAPVAPPKVPFFKSLFSAIFIQLPLPRCKFIDTRCPDYPSYLYIFPAGRARLAPLSPPITPRASYRRRPPTSSSFERTPPSRLPVPAHGVLVLVRAPSSSFQMPSSPIDAHPHGPDVHAHGDPDTEAFALLVYPGPHACTVTLFKDAGCASRSRL
ncbi:hypothetical protein B0H16DRAFT_1729830 [Mycena metata]|uniref:Uncharacterized protein n=1 Tax=Mycena metata TaxID=1033252 RepID=A0AAD7IAS0_9AGAR|nr:hypothetical protein B0H16DRAFT_1729830 [Mycena metata]